MAIEQVGPGGVGNSYGVRTASSVSLFNTAKPKKVYSEFGATPEARYALDSSGNVTGLVGGGPLGSGVRVGILGDSITQENFDQSTTAITERPRWFTQANSLLGQRMELVNNAGVNGDTTAKILTRLLANGAGLGAGFGGIGAAGTAVTTSPSPLLNSPRYVFVHAGVNDIYGFSTDTATITGNLQAIYQALLAGGATPVALTIMPVGTGAVGYNTANVVQHLEVNDWIRAYCAQNRNMLLVDAFAALVDPTNASVAAAAGVMRDSVLHPNNLGGLLVARAVQNVMQYIIPPASLLPSSNAAEYTLDPGIKQLLPNPLLTGTAAITATGYSGSTAGSNLANSNFVRGGTPTCVLSAVSRSDGYGQDTKFVPTFAASGDSLEMRMPSQHARAVVGGRYIAVCEISATGPAGAALVAADNLQGVQLYLQYNDGTTNFFTYAEGRGGTDVALVGSFTKTLRTPVLTIPAGGVSTTFRPNLGIFGAGVGSPEIRVGRIGLIRVA